MKRFLVLMLVMGLTLCGLPFSSNAAVEKTFEFNNKTVKFFTAENTISLEKVEAICEFVANDNSDEVSACSVLCIFGHKIEYSDAVVTDHNYYTTSPLCRKTIYEVETCARESCSYMNKTIVDQSRISSCHG